MSLFMQCVPYLGASLALVALVACATPRRFGDPEGLPITFTVTVERAFFENMHNHQWSPSVGAGVGLGSGGGSGAGLGVGLGFAGTSIYLIGGDAAGQADVFRKELKWGDNTFTVPLRPGRTMVLGVQAEGGRVGWESLGSVTVPAASDVRVTVVMDANGGRIDTVPARSAVNATMSATR